MTKFESDKQFMLTQMQTLQEQVKKLNQDEIHRQIEKEAVIQKKDEQI